MPASDFDAEKAAMREQNGSDHTEPDSLDKELQLEAELSPRPNEDGAESYDADGEDIRHADEEVAQPSGEDKDPFEVGWDDGENDPLNPRSFSKLRKWLIVIIVSSSSFCVTAASSIYTSTYTQMEAEFGNSREVSIAGLSTFVLGISLGPMVIGPMSEFYGRRPIYLISWASYIIWIIPQAVAPNVATIIINRFLDGFSGSTFLAVSGGTVGDLFEKSQLQAPMAMFSIAPFIGPSLGPLVGGFINYYSSWRWTYYLLLIWACVIYVAIIFFVPETYHPILIRNKARKMRKDTGDDRWVAPSEKEQKSIASSMGRSLLRPFQLLILEPMCLNLCIFSSILLGIIYLFFDAIPLVMETNHHFKEWQVGLSFLGILFGMLAALGTDPIWFRIRARLMKKLEQETGVPGSSEPEFRLPPTIFGSLVAPTGLFIFGWSSYASVHWIVPIIGSGVFGAGVVLSFTGIFTFLVDSYPLYAASALAANAFLRCLFAAAFPLFGIQMYDKLGYQWASTLLAFLTVIMIPFPYIFFRYGKKIRRRSRFATKN